jgi:glycosyltransferase involved in cell wall biosynthesis
MSTKLSIIVVTFNAQKTICECLESILQQKTSEVEVIVIDGASKDETLKIISSYADQIDVFKSEPDSGIYHAMNKGIREASGEYILFINSDDHLAPKTVNNFLQTIKESRSFDVLIGPVQAMTSSGEITGEIHPSWDKNKIEYFFMPVCHQGLIIKKKVLAELGGFDQNYKIVADFDLFLKLLKNSYSILEVKYPIANYRVGGVSGGSYKKELRVLYTKHGFPLWKGELALKYSSFSQWLQSVLPGEAVRIIKKLKKSRYQNFGIDSK